MHRLSRWARRGSALVFLGVVLLGACNAGQGLRDQAEVERLRMRITKVRHAIRETRTVIAQSRGAAYADELLMRLAELQSEEAQYHYLLAQQRENSTGAVHAPQVRFLKEEAIALFERILRENPDTELGDRILFNIAHEQRELGNFDAMIATLRRLTDDERYRNSRYRNEALLLLGDHAFDLNDMSQAGHHYRKILEAADNPLHPLAQYKLAWVYVNAGNCGKALHHFEGSIESARRWSDVRAQAAHKAAVERLEAERAGIQISGTPAAEGEVDDDSEQSSRHKGIDVRREALVDLVYCYSTQRPANEVISYLRERAFDRGAYVAALERAAARYGVMEEAVGGAAVARELLRLAPDDEDRLDDARMLHAAVTRSEDFSQVGEDVTLILRALRRRISGPNLTQEARRRLKSQFEILARDLATKAQTQAEEDDSPSEALAASEAYHTYLLNLPDSEQRVAMTANLADSFALARGWLEAGRGYRELAEKAPQPDERNQAHYESVAAYQKFLLSDQPRTQLERVEARAGLRQAGLAYLKTSPAAEKAVKIRFAVAQTYYDEGRYHKAIDLLTALAFEFPGSPESEGAINLVLDSYNTLNDYDGLIAAGQMFLGSSSPASASLRQQLRPLVTAAEERRLDELSLDASGESAGGTKRLEALAQRYQGTDFGEQALLRAFEAARASGNVDRMYKLANQLAQDYRSSQQLPGVLSSVGRTSAARFEFERALELYDRAAEANPDERPMLMLASGQLREELADYAGAARAYQQALRATDELSLQRDSSVRLADLLERQGNMREVIAVLSPLAASGDPEVLSRLGLAESRQGEVDQALTHLDQALAGGASDQASARAQYGQAELTLASLERFRPEPSIDGIQELLDLVDQTESLYLGVIQQGDTQYGFAAFARVARAYQVASRLLRELRLTDVEGPEAQEIQEAITARAEQIGRQADEALGACAERVLALHRFDRSARACLGGEPPERDPAVGELLQSRHAATLNNVEELRAQIAANPEHVESLQALGERYLAAGDFHAARLILARAVEVEGNSERLNLLGLAAARAGDQAGALEAFSRAAEGGSEAARLNLSSLLRAAGLTRRADEVRRQVRGTPPRDQLLPGTR